MGNKGKSSNEENHNIQELTHHSASEFPESGRKIGDLDLLWLEMRVFEQRSELVC